MKVIYSTCYADPWIQVAKKLQEEYNFDPIYWIGYHDDLSNVLVSQHFPGIIYHPYFDAWKGVFPDKIKKFASEGNIDLDFLNENARYELQAIRMMDRMDADQHSFSFQERQQHFRMFVKHWSGVLDNLKPDLIISAVVPHRVYDYVLYLLCQNRNIPFFSFRSTSFLGRIMPVMDISKIDSKVIFNYNELLKGKADNSHQKLEQDIKERFEKVKMDYNTAEPLYMKRHVKANKKDSSIVGITRSFITRVVEQKDLFFGKENYLLNGIPTFHKEKSKSIENSRMSLLQHANRKLTTNRIKRRLKEYYLSKVESVDYSKPFIFLPLHYQPEMTSNPSGDVFTDQLLCVDVLAKNLPDNYSIYIKEHKAQFYAHREGHAARTKAFYDALKQYPNVKFLSLEEDTFELISKSKAVATISGTVGWEAMVRQKPVIVFGLAWYEGYNGVLKIQDNATAEKIYDFIHDFQYDENDLYAYLLAFQKNSTRGYYYRSLKEKMDMPEDICVENLSQAILEKVK